jgi:hypothetical protein
MNIEIRQTDDDTSYLDMNELSYVADPGQGGNVSSLQSKAKEFRPIRNAVMHTALISDEAKIKLKDVFNDIKARLKELLKNG